MAMKEHPFVVTTTFEGDGDTIAYDKTKPGRGDAVGKAFKINPTTHKAELVADGDEIDGVVIGDINDKHQFTGAYMFGGLLVPIGTGQTINRGDRLVGALGASSAKGYVKSVPAIPADLAAVAADADIDTEAEVRAAVNADRAAINTLGEILGGRGKVLETNTTHALWASQG